MKQLLPLIRTDDTDRRRVVGWGRKATRLRSFGSRQTSPLAHDDSLWRGGVCAAHRLQGCDPLPDWAWVTQGSPKRHPRATQACREGLPSVDWRKRLCLQQISRKRGRARYRPGTSLTSPVIGKPKAHRGDAENSQGRMIGKSKISQLRAERA